MTLFGKRLTGAMDKTVRYHPLFDCDVIEAAGWYDQRSPGLGDSFIEAARSAANQIIDQPSLYAATEYGLRYVRLRRFPYIVLFDETKDEILMLGVLHTARSIDKWRERRHE